MQEQMYFPEGGVGSFLTSNMDEMPDNVLAFGQPRGINSMGDVANRMAQMGRNGDTELAHVNRDEIIIDRNMARDPRIRNAVAEVFSDNDMDMSRYTVGNAANSVNPYTGNKEFFLKKIISGVKKIVKAAAPIVLPAVIGLATGGLGLGLMAQGALTGGLTALATGGNRKDLLRGALFGGLAGGISSGIQRYSQAASGEGIAAFKEGFVDSAPEFLKGRGQNFLFPKNDLVEASRSFKDTLSSDFPAPSEQYSGEKLLPNTAETAVSAEAAIPPLDIPKDIKLADYTTEGSFFKKPEITFDAAKKYLIDSDMNVTTDAIKEVMGQASGGYKILPTVGATLGIGALAGGLKQIPAAELEDPYDSNSPAEDRLAANPEMYTTGVPGAPSYRSLYDVMVPTVRQPIYQQFVEPVQTAARGGEMQNFPRRTGYIGGPGTETSDSIPAMLSDGEFVMNAKAVRGAGNGSRERGVRKMYDMMRAFEGGAVA